MKKFNFVAEYLEVDTTDPLSSWLTNMAEKQIEITISEV